MRSFSEIPGPIVFQTAELSERTLRESLTVPIELVKLIWLSDLESLPIFLSLVDGAVLGRAWSFSEIVDIF